MGIIAWNFTERAYMFVRTARWHWYSKKTLVALMRLSGEDAFGTFKAKP